MKDAETLSMMVVLVVIGGAIGAAAASRSGTTTVVSTFTTGSQSQTTASATMVTATTTHPNVLLNLTGSGNATSKSFQTPSMTLEIIIVPQATSSNPPPTQIRWYLNPQSGSGWVAEGSETGASSATSSYAYNLSVGGEYYLDVVTASANWEIIVIAQ